MNSNLKTYIDDFNPRYNLHRGATIGSISQLMFSAANKIGLPINNQGRSVRLKIATELFDREINTYNDLESNELYGLFRYLRTEEGKFWLKNWLQDTYGYQERLL